MSRNGSQTIGRKTRSRHHRASAEQRVSPQAPAATGAHNTCFQRVQDDMSKAKSVGRDWEFVSKGTEISLGKFVSEYFTPLTLGLQTGVVSTEDTDEIWGAAKEEAMEKTKGRETRRARATSPMVDETEVEKSF